ncbi:LysR family transcriptional regulator [Streptomyces sp. NPDC021093]|uniref:LysR family transcriptional regulator n=1 Tax=Streptomyces sp. NPDC021093 TaxID=3365112 RepID=UPI00379C9739
MTVTDAPTAAPHDVPPLSDDVDDIDMRHLRYFLAVVRAGTVSAAALELHIAQPSLSQQIRRLEQRIGVPLFSRSSRGVELTAGGRVFLEGVRSIPGQLRSAIAAAAPVPATWSVGVCEGVPAEVLDGIEQGLRDHAYGRDPDSPWHGLRLRQVTSAQQRQLLENGELDLGIVRLPTEATAGPALAMAVLRDEPLGVVLQSRHPLVAKFSLTAHDLRTQRLLWYDTGCAPGQTSTVLKELAAMGWRPELYTPADGQQALFAHALRSTPDLVALRPRSAVRDLPRLAWRPLAADTAPHERLALVAAAGTPQSAVLHRIADEALLGFTAADLHGQAAAISTGAPRAGR